MKIWKHWIFTVIIAIFGIVGFIGCDNGNTHTHDWEIWKITTFPTETLNGIETRICTVDESHTETKIFTLATFQTYFYGTWEGPNVLTLNADSYRQEDSPDSVYLGDNLVWAVTINNNANSKDEYPAGYNLNMTINGDNISFPLYINSTKDGICNDGLYYYNYYTWTKK